jgi:hypothetical protein
MTRQRRRSNWRDASSAPNLLGLCRFDLPPKTISIHSIFPEINWVSVGMAGLGCCRLCGGPLPPRKPGAGRPRSKCDACRDLRRPPVAPNWDSDLVRAVQRDYPDGDSDPFTYMAWMLAAELSGASHAKDAVPLSKELRRSLAYLDGREKPHGYSDGLDELRLRRGRRLRS